MPFVIYRTDSTKLLLKHTNGMWRPVEYVRKNMAEKMAQEQTEKDGHSWSATDKVTFHKSIEKTETRKHIFGGGESKVPINAPWTSGAWSETFWSS